MFHQRYADIYVYGYCLILVLITFQRGEIVQWISQGGGEVISGKTKQIVHYTVECHGVTPMLTDDSTSLDISSHWIRSCLEVSLISHKCRFPFSALSQDAFYLLHFSGACWAKIRDLYVE